MASAAIISIALSAKRQNGSTGDWQHHPAEPKLRFKERRCPMYALIYDEHRPDEPQKKVISVHRSRQTAEKALDKRRLRLGRKIWECNTRIVWVEKNVAAGDYVRPSEFDTWRPGEVVPEGETHSDTD
jgi:hypothetical protein